MIFLLANMMYLIVWWLGSDDDAPVAMDAAGPSTPAAPATITMQSAHPWETEIAKDPFGARDWPRGSAQQWVPPAVSVGPVAAAQTAAVPAVIRSDPLRAAPPQPSSMGDSAPGIGQEPAPAQPPE